MKIGSITGYNLNVNRRTNKSNVKSVLCQPEQPPIKNEPSFKGSSIGKVGGFILGAIAISVIAPPVAMAGLAGLGAVPGMMLGHELDKKIDKSNGEKTDD